ncbi:MAG: hypothetical protein JXR70_10660 [Spirochaetales bacterium]|nr:hypothetical protein [Spirochaetales bacterium]
MNKSDYTKAWKTLLMTKSREPVALPVLSGSMHPLIQTEDVLIIQPCKAGDLHLGDIAVFSVKNRIFAHRVVFIFLTKRWKLIMEKGIQNKFPGWLKPGQVLGRGLGVKRGKQNISFLGRENRQIQRAESCRELLKVIGECILIPARFILSLIRKS